MDRRRFGGAHSLLVGELNGKEEKFREEEGSMRGSNCRLLVHLMSSVVECEKAK